MFNIYLFKCDVDGDYGVISTFVVYDVFYWFAYGTSRALTASSLRLLLGCRRCISSLDVITSQLVCTRVGIDVRAANDKGSLPLWSLFGGPIWRTGYSALTCFILHDCQSKIRHFRNTAKTTNENGPLSGWCSTYSQWKFETSTA